MSNRAYIVAGLYHMIKDDIIVDKNNKESFGKRQPYYVETIGLIPKKPFKEMTLNELRDFLYSMIPFMNYHVRQSSCYSYMPQLQAAIDMINNDISELSPAKL